MIYNTHLKGVEGEVETYQRKQAFTKKDDTSIVLVPDPLTHFKMNYSPVLGGNHFNKGVI